MFTTEGTLWFALPGVPEQLVLAPERVKAATDNPLEFRVEADPAASGFATWFRLGHPNR